MTVLRAALSSQVDCARRRRRRRRRRRTRVATTYKFHQQSPHLRILGQPASGKLPLPSYSRHRPPAVLLAGVATLADRQIRCCHAAVAPSGFYGQFGDGTLRLIDANHIRVFLQRHKAVKFGRSAPLYPGTPRRYKNRFYYYYYYYYYY